MQDVKEHGQYTGGDRGFSIILDRATEGLHAARTRFQRLFGSETGDETQ